MPSQPPSRASVRNIIALLALIAAFALFAAASFASAPAKMPSPAKVSWGRYAVTYPYRLYSGVECSGQPEAPTRISDLVGVDAVSSTDVWAVGAGIIDHWNGSDWTVLTDTIPLTTPHVWCSAVSANDVWAVGRGDGAGHYTGVTFTGTAAVGATYPIRPRRRNRIFDVKAISTNDVWAVGYQFDFGSSYALTMHWNGTTWS